MRFSRAPGAADSGAAEPPTSGRALLVAAVAMALVSATGCGALFSPPKPPAGVSASPAECQRLLKDVAPGHYHAATVILLDRSASTVARATGADSPDWLRLLGPLLPDDSRDVVSIGSFGGDTEPVWTISHQIIPGRSSSVVLQRQVDAVVRSCLREGLRQADQASPPKPGTDIVAAIAAAAARLNAYHGSSRRIVIATDGLDNIGCASLATVAVGDPSQTNAILSACKPDLPSLAGTRVDIYGVGHPASDQPALSAPQISWLKQLWHAICAATGAAGSCPVQTDTDTIQKNGPPVPDQADPAVRMPQISMSRQKPRQEVITIPESILFATGSAALSPGYESELAAVVGEIRALHFTSVDVSGYTDARGSGAYNLDLSRRRANAVATALRARGVRPSKITGFGKADPACVPEYNPDGTPNLRNMACDRRVEVIVHIS